MLYSSHLQRAALLLAGPFGCYVVYNAAFIWRIYDPNKYPALAQFYEWPRVPILFGVYGVALAVSVWATVRFVPYPWMRSQYSSLSRFALALMVIATAALMGLSVFRVFGTLSPSVVAGDYANYYRMSRLGGAWIILASCAILYVFLLDMYFAGVSRWNSAALLMSVAINFVAGGRSILMCVLLAHIILLYTQRPLYRHLFAGLAATVAIAALSFLSVTHLRLPSEDASAQAVNYKMNYNSAFVVNDVLRGLDERRLTPYPHFLVDTMYLMPRALLPSKPLSTSDTRAVYPEIASRGTTMSFPLSANIAMHLGTWAFFLGPIVAAFCQLVFVWGAAKRVGLVSFLAFFWGAMFVLAARGGILNYRMVLHSIIITILFLAYTRIAKSFLAGWIMARPIQR